MSFEDALGDGWRLLWMGSIPMLPIPKGRGRAFEEDGKVHVKTPTKTKRAEKDLALAVKGLYPDKRLDSGPVGLYVEFCFPIPKSAIGKRWPGQPHVGTPDASNLGKLVEDALNGILYRDDSQLAEVRFKKTWEASQQIRIALYGPEGQKEG